MAVQILRPKRSAVVMKIPSGVEWRGVEWSGVEWSGAAVSIFESCACEINTLPLISPYLSLQTLKDCRCYLGILCLVVNMVSYDPQGSNDVELCALNVSRSRYDDITAGLEDIERSVRLARMAAVLSAEDVKQLMQFQSRCKHHWRALYFQRNPTNNQIKMKVHLRRSCTTYYAEEFLDELG